MGDKSVPRSGGMLTKFHQMKNKLKIVIVVSLILLVLIWNTAPFRSTDSPSGRSDAQGSGSNNIAELFGGHALHNEDGQRQGGDSGEPPASKTMPSKGEENSTEEISERQTLEQNDQALEDTTPEAISECQTLKQKDKELEDSLSEEIPEHQNLKQSIEVDHSREEEGSRRSEKNILRTQIFEEIPSQSLNYTTILTKASRDSNCEGKYIYVYELPPEFNLDLAA